MNEKKTLYQHRRHGHTPRNVAEVHSTELQEGSLNTRIAVLLTRGVGSMWTAYSFVILAIIGLFAILGWLSPLVALLVAWTSQTLIQLVLLPIILVGQNTLSRHAELMAEEQFRTTVKSYDDIGQIMSHLDVQDAKILDILTSLETQQQHIVKQHDLLTALQHRLAEQTMYRRDWK